MASTGSYGDPDAQMGGGSGIYVSQNAGSPPAQPQQQHMHTDPDLQLRENLQQLQQGTEIMHSGPPPHQMGPMNPAHHHFHTPPRPTHSPQHMAQSAQSVMGLEDHNPYGDHDNASRKRSKVSRACDECRRKKIRCDATSENGPEACSSCKRTGARCQFSRQPMKRGPSKGYIKELADRLNSLENQIQQPHTPSLPYDFAVGDPSLGDTQTPSQFSRKRTHSMSEGFQDPYGRPNWSGQDREHPLNGNPPTAIRRVSFGEMTLAGNLITGSNETTLKAYYNIIHPTLPLLPQDSSSLNRLTQCPPKLREAFFLSLECSIRSFAPGALARTEFVIDQLINQCSEAVDAAKRELRNADSSSQFFSRVVYCQCLVFLTMASDRPGPSNIEGTTELLARLAGSIEESGLDDAKTVTFLREQDFDLYLAARRTFWVAFILDRFHASSRSKAIFLPLRPGSVSREEFDTLGEVAYHLARAANVVGRIAFFLRTGNHANPDPSSSSALEMLTGPAASSVLLNTILDSFQESLECTNLPSNSPPYLAYEYLRIFIARLSDPGSSYDILPKTKELLGNLANGSITPLNHIFASLVATSLTDLSDRVETQVEAHASIKEMSDALAHGNIVHLSDGSGWDAAIRDLLHQKKAPTPPNIVPEPTSAAVQPNMAGLQHLAAAAVGEREGADARPASSGNATATSNQPKVDHDLQAAVQAANEAAKAQATAAAAEKQMQNTSANGGNGNNYESALGKDGFLSV